MIKIILRSILSEIQDNLPEKMKGSKFIYDYVDRLYYSCHKITLNCGGSYTESPYCLKTRKAFISPKNDNDLNMPQQLRYTTKISLAIVKIFLILNLLLKNINGIKLSFH